MFEAVRKLREHLEGGGGRWEPTLRSYTKSIVRFGEPPGAGAGRGVGSYTLTLYQLLCSHRVDEFVHS